MPAVASYVSSDDGLGNEDIYSHGIQWTLWKQLDDLAYADDLALLSHTPHQRPALLQTPQQVWALRSIGGRVKS